MPNALSNNTLSKNTLFGSLERFIGILIEHYAGRFPTWLAPTQLSVLTISEKSHDYAERVYKQFKRAGLRVILDCGREKIGHKVREHTLNQVPYMVVVGAKEAESGQVNVRHISGESLGAFALSAALEYLMDAAMPPYIKEADFEKTDSNKPEIHR